MKLRLVLMASALVLTATGARAWDDQGHMPHDADDQVDDDSDEEDDDED